MMGAIILSRVYVSVMSPSVYKAGIYMALLELALMTLVCHVTGEIPYECNRCYERIENGGERPRVPSVRTSISAYSSASRGMDQEEIEMERRANML